MNLFDQVERTYMGPASNAEPDFPFLNRSARKEMVKVRNLLEDWFEAFPESSKIDLRSRFRSQDNRQHQAAFFEIYCHALMQGMGFEVEIHPSSNGGSTRPDFLV